MSAPFRILKDYESVRPFLNSIREHADAHREALGFMAEPVYEQAASKGRLWVCVERDTKNYCGHLFFGGSRGTVRVFQVYANNPYRKQGIGRKLVEELISQSENEGHLQVVSRVASELPANQFWERMGFRIIRQENKADADKRTINIRGRILDTPSLLREYYPEHQAALSIAQKGALRPHLSPPRLMLDVNIYMDVLHDRNENSPALISEAFANRVSLVVAEEFMIELERNARGGGGDPVLAFARRMPTLEPPPGSKKEKLVQTLRKLVFPQRDPNGRKSHRDQSDLAHLATAIYHTVDGFVTGEKAILRAAGEIYKTYGLRVYFPQELFDAANGKQEGSSPSATFSPGTSFADRPFRPTDLRVIKQLANNLKCDAALVQEIARSSEKDPESFFGIILQNEKTVGAYGLVLRRDGRHADAAVLIDETASAAELMIDHCFQGLFDALPCKLGIRLHVHAGVIATQTLDTARRLGFSTASGSAGYPVLSKLALKRPWGGQNWEDVKASIRNECGWTTDEVLPNYRELANTGIRVIEEESQTSVYLPLERIETIFSPTAVLPKGRSGLIVPIKQNFAQGLIGNIEQQLTLFDTSAAQSHPERAYFRSTANMKRFLPGTFILLYVSGQQKGGKRVIASARITYSAALPVTQIVGSFTRQGVLSKPELEVIAAKNNGRVHVFTFDNILRLPVPVTYRDLKTLGCVSRANLVTAEEISHEKVLEVMRRAFPERSKPWQT